jgi:hypothetical protein
LFTAKDAKEVAKERKDKLHQHRENRCLDAPQAICYKNFRALCTLRDAAARIPQ